MSLRKMITVVALCSISLAGHTAGSSTRINITGKLLLPAECTVNGGTDMNINFDTVKLEEADGKKVTRPLLLPISCTNTSGDPVYVKLQLNGTPGFRADVLESSIDDFGFIFTPADGGANVPLNKDFVIGYTPGRPLAWTVAAIANPKPAQPIKAGDFTCCSHHLFHFSHVATILWRHHLHSPRRIVTIL